MPDFVGSDAQILNVMSSPSQVAVHPGKTPAIHRCVTQSAAPLLYKAPLRCDSGVHHLWCIILPSAKRRSVPTAAHPEA